MPFLHNLGPLEAVIMGVGCLATVAVPIGEVAVAMYMSRRSNTGVPKEDGKPGGSGRREM